MNRRRWLPLLISLQVLILATIASSWYAIDIWGKEIRLKTKPYDQSEPMIDKEIDLVYQQSEISSSLWKGKQREYLQTSNRWYYAKLAPVGRTWEVQGIYPEKPTSHGDEVILRTQVEEMDSKKVMLHFGLEEYTLPQGTHVNWPDNKPLITKIKVAPWGQAKVISVSEE
ncbi:GDYXXLXY protein [Marininema mesophilum]|uniref:GDYXXLXY protein n=1 Tax=Marininema mesophilum TaxID=1048340 RepID=A0A1H2ZW78_9BACL|nr:GDYXXLXY domain-containing protein [Marininema mesophilum]SDX21577.1 GDYXXLXY protein [Marininema mesophilum]